MDHWACNAANIDRRTELQNRSAAQCTAGANRPVSTLGKHWTIGSRTMSRESDTDSTLSVSAPGQEPIYHSNMNNRLLKETRCSLC